eukprot:11886719-Heterocapsa_arctica.AAC.1
MGFGTHKEQTRDRKPAMANAFYVNVTKRDCSTYGGNVKPLKAIRTIMDAEPQCLWATGHYKRMDRAARKPNS